MILNVAEKHSVAKQIAQILSEQRQIQNLASKSKFNPILQLNRSFRGNSNATLIITSVCGHIMNHDFTGKYRNWTMVDPSGLFFDADIAKSVDPSKTEIIENLKSLAPKATDLVLWLDCDREGEAIAFEVVDVCRSVKKNITIWRAKFSAVTHPDIFRAYNNLEKPNQLLSEAVEMRQEVDLRIGAAFTRLQTLTLQKKFLSLNKNIISYGPCQFPTLGFIVDRYLKHENFVPEEFWYIFCTVNHKSENKKIEFKWVRGKLFDLHVTAALYETVYDNSVGYITHIERKETTKRRPLPLNTIAFQKLGTKKLRMTSAELMDAAEKLYQAGLISYPRTETDSFPKTINIQQLVSNHFNSPIWGDYANKLINHGKFCYPLAGGKDDKAHPPIHPVKLPNTELKHPHDKVYEFICRHFLAVCSDNAKGFETKIELTVADEKFMANGLMITEMNYLEIFIYEKWNENSLPVFSEGEQVAIAELLLQASKTTAPPYITENELIAMMDKNGIGTDATIHEHIKTVQERNYAHKVGIYFKPSKLGLALVQTYDSMNMSLAKPLLRAAMERDMNMVADGKMKKEEAIKRSLQQMHEVFLKVQENKQILVKYVGEYMDQISRLEPGLDGEIIEEEMILIKEGGSCGSCGNLTKIMTSDSRLYLFCEICKSKFIFPKAVTINLVNHLCPYCQYQVYEIINEKDKSYKLCPKCYHDPPLEDIENLSGNNFLKSITMPCFKCKHTSCPYSEQKKLKGILSCSLCKKGHFHPKRSKIGNWFLGCNGFPDCRATIYMPKVITDVKATEVVCSFCKAHNTESYLCELKFEDGPDLSQEIYHVIHNENSFFCLNDCKSILFSIGYNATIKIYENKAVQNLNNSSGANQTHHTNQNPISNYLKKGYNQQNEISDKNNQQNNIFHKNHLLNSSNSMINNNYYASNKYAGPNNVNKNSTQSSSTNVYPRQNVNVNSSSNSGVTCYSCGEVGHIAPSCPKKGNVKGNTFKTNNNNNNNKEFKKNNDKTDSLKGTTKICSACGNVGRHPNGSACIKVKNNKNGKKQNDGE